LRKKKFSRVVVFLGLSLLILSSNAFSENSRAKEIAEKKAEKAKELKIYSPNKAERIITRLDRPRKGIYPLVGSAYSGGGFALGVGYWKLLGDRDYAEVHGMYSIEQYKQLTATAALFQSPFGIYRTDLLAKYVDAGHVSFFGIGNDTEKSDKTNFGYSPIQIRATETLHPAKYIFGGGSFEYLRINTGPGDDSSTPSIEKVYTPATAPGIGTDPEYTVAGLFAAFDWRQSPGYTTTGGYYRVDWYNYHGINDDASTDFRRIDLEASQYIPVLRGNQIIAVRALASITDTNGDEEIPFFLEPKLGGGEELRGFRSHRFRDRNRLLLTAEYRWTPSKFLDMAIFYEAGKVANKTGDLDFNNLHHCWGIGARFHAPAATVLRIELAHSNESTRIIFGTGLLF
jgi:outer membrane protein assembly factor BamA